MSVDADKAVEIFDPMQGVAQHEDQARELGARTLPERRLAAAILMLGKLSPAQLQESLSRAATMNRQLAQQLTDDKVLESSDLAEVRAAAAGLRFVELEELSIPPQALRTLPPEVARQHQALPFRLDLPVEASDLSEVTGMVGATVWVALANPLTQGKNIIAKLLTDQGLHVQFVASDPDKIDRLIASRYALLSEGGLADAPEDVDEDADSEDLSAINHDDGPARQFATQIFTEALERGASDVHVEVNPGEEKGLTVRYRIDGVSRALVTVPEMYRRPTVNALKLDLGMDIAQNRRFQSGRASKLFENRRVDFRGELVPTDGGESLIIRILDREGLPMDLAKMGMSPGNLTTFQKTYRNPHGAILVTGPTGSGKTTTLYAVLAELNDPGKVIFTIEEPVEYRLGGVQHISVSEKEGRTFAGALRSCMRADPDIIMVGEIRDEDTAVTAMRATLTGHLVLSTLHTTEAAETPVRLLDMGLAPFVVAGALSVVVTQRLVRRLCPSCKERYTPELEELMLVGYSEESAKQVIAAADRYQLHRAGKGCRQCGGLSYKGRTAVHEVLLVNEEIRRIILSADRSTEKIRSAAIRNGMRTLKQDGLDKAFQGVTSLEEVRRVLG